MKIKLDLEQNKRKITGVLGDGNRKRTARKPGVNSALAML